MFWWQWVLIFLAFCVLIFAYIIIFGSAFAIRILRTDPTLPSFEITEEGTFVYRILKPNGFSETDWKRKSPNPTKIRFKFYIQGIGKSEETDKDDSDLLEFPNSKGDKKLVIFGLRFLDKVASVKIRRLMDLLIDERNKNARLNQEKEKLEGKMEKLIDDRLTQMKKQVILPIMPKKKTQ